MRENSLHCLMGVVVLKWKFELLTMMLFRARSVALYGFARSDAS